jgi:hypothetical protein
MIWLAWVSCDGQEEPPPEDEVPVEPEPPPPVELPEPCLEQPCVVDMATARYESTADWPSYAGYAMAVAGDRLVVGAPFWFTGQESGTPQVLSLSLPELRQEGAWQGDQNGDITGAALAGADVDGDGVVEVAVSEIGGFSSQEGSPVYLISGQVEGEHLVGEDTLLTIVGDEGIRLGFDLFFSADAAELIINGTSKAATDGRVLAFSTADRGTRDEDDALRVITAPGPLGPLGRWDGNADGQDDLLVQHYWHNALAWFEGPWVSGDIESSDVEWRSYCTDSCDFGYAIEDLGDITGDGAADLGVSSPKQAEPRERAGRVYVLDNIGEGGNIEDVPLQVHGAQRGDGMGFALAGADLDGDGQQDLVASASGVAPGDRPGTLLVYRGPVQPAVHTMDQADAIVRGQYAYDYFVRSIAVLDVDDDGRDDLAVGAPGWPAGLAQGAVYLLPGAELLP